MSTPSKETFLIGVAGGSASGKTTLCKNIINKLGLKSVQILTMDHFYAPLSREDHANANEYNFDHPNAFDWELFNNVLEQVKEGKVVQLPQWDYTTHTRKQEYETLDGAHIDVLLCEGILTFYDEHILNKFDVKVFVKEDDDVRLIRRIKRDITERNRSLESVLTQYTKTVKKSHELYCEPTMKSADIVVNDVRPDAVAVDVLCNLVKSKLNSRSKM